MEENKKNNEEFVALINRLWAMKEAGQASVSQLQNFINGLEKRVKRKEKKDKDLNNPVGLSNGQGENSFGKPFITADLSETIWGENLPLSETPDPKYLLFKKNSVFTYSSFSWSLVWLNGFSVQEIARKFPNEFLVSNLSRYDWFSERSQAGYYLISWLNPFINYSLEKEKEKMPEDCWRLPGNLLLEFLITLRRIGGEVPKTYFRTYFDNKHNINFCLGLKNGVPENERLTQPFIFTPARGGKYKALIGVCLMKIRPYQ